MEAGGAVSGQPKADSRDWVMEIRDSGMGIGIGVGIGIGIGIGNREPSAGSRLPFG